MNTTMSGRRGASAVLTAAILAVVGLGLAGCQTAAVDRSTTRDQQPAPSAVQVERSAAASQARYEGLAEYWALRGQQPAGSVRVLADRVDTQLTMTPREVAQVRVVPDRLDVRYE